MKTRTQRYEDVETAHFAILKQKAVCVASTDEDPNTQLQADIAFREALETYADALYLCTLAEVQGAEQADAVEQTIQRVKGMFRSQCA